MELEVQSGFGVYETRGPCQKIAFIQLAVSLCSFFLTWYRVYWETLIFMGVSFIGVIATREPIDHSKTRLANAVSLFTLYITSALANSSSITTEISLRLRLKSLPSDV